MHGRMPHPSAGAGASIDGRPVAGRREHHHAGAIPDLLEHAGLLRGLGKYAGEKVRQRARLPGIDAFEREFGRVRKILVGGQGLPLEDFFTTDPAVLV